MPVLDEEWAKIRLKQKPQIRTESLQFFEWGNWNGMPYQTFYGIGVVYKIIKMEKKDLVYVRFSSLPNRQMRMIVLYKNHARRQLATLKRGQICQVYGTCVHYESKVKGKKYPVHRLGLFAEGIIGWYVPTMLDIKKIPVNDDIEPPSSEEENLTQDLDSVLDEFMTRTGEDELWKD